MRLILYTLLYIVIAPLYWVVFEINSALTRLWSYILLEILKEKTRDEDKE